MMDYILDRLVTQLLTDTPRYLMAPRPNVTGFDPKKMAEASRSAKGDPWAR
jgi:hypothetical protein